MPYCRRCGTQLEENARFCHKCGLSVDANISPPQATTQPYTMPPPTPAPIYTQTPHKTTSNRIILLTVGIIVILLVASIAAALLFVPLTPWGVSKSLSDGTPNVDTLNLNFATNIGEINIMTLQVGGKNVLIHVQGNGSYSYLTKTDNPMTVTFDNQTAGGTTTVNGQVTVANPYTSSAKVAIQIYVNPSIKLNLNVTSATGKVSLTADRGSIIQSLYLQSTTGTAEANLSGNTTLTGPVSLKTTTGEVNYRMNEIDVINNCTVNLQTTTGEVGLDITETSMLHGNVAVHTSTTTGSIYVGLEVDVAVGAKITSTTNLGEIKTDLSNFNGDKSPLYSSNYPAASNIEITNTASTGSINIQARSQTVTISS